MKKTRGIISNKETIALTIQKLAKKSKSLSDFAKKLEEESFQPYYRNDKLSGIWMENRKYRLTTLGVDKSKIRQLTLEEARLHQLLKAKGRDRHNDKEL